ncbi:hypothetical protein Pcinc_037812 [Petrolisthes cinctipes]|uniref:Uncharacterized protein n=1 Tax=Petrolisthes cinctipes TaxID=88211 RepID=A0AAE1BRW0_PETCI|nr:hypothetical protein Pcinc_037812 [Petrolisthes cinctipes]
MCATAKTTFKKMKKVCLSEEEPSTSSASVSPAEPPHERASGCHKDAVQRQCRSGFHFLPYSCRQHIQKQGTRVETRQFHVKVEQRFVGNMLLQQKG